MLYPGFDIGYILWEQNTAGTSYLTVVSLKCNIRFLKD